VTAAHTSKYYENELRTLREKLVLMGSLAEEMIEKGISALTTRDSELAAATIKIDRRINRLECEVDELCMRILATRQPVASDLRFITIALKTVTDLERIGDLGVNICERVIELNEEAPLPIAVGIQRLADETIVSLREALDALVGRDEAHATELLDRDDTIDALYAEIFEQILALMAKDPATIYRATRVQSIAKYLERIADHAMNLAEAVVFLVKGKDVRHKHRPSESDIPEAMPKRALRPAR
jgi:phosphate transport system protein